MAANLAILNFELVNDPLNRGYLFLSADQVSQDLSVLYRFRYHDVLISAILGEFLSLGIWSPLITLASGGTTGDPVHDAAYSAIITIIQLLSNTAGIDRVYMSDPVKRASVENALLALSTYGTITDANRNAILDLSRTLITRADELGLGGAPLPSDVIAALAL